MRKKKIFLICPVRNITEDVKPTEKKSFNNVLLALRKQNAELNFINEITDFFEITDFVGECCKGRWEEK